MPEEQKGTYPVIPAKHWWTLRKRFQQSIPGAVTPGFLATLLDMKEESAKANIIPSLIMMGIIDRDGKSKDRAVKWRDDAAYPDVCREIRNELYPQELLDAMPGPSIDRPAVERWFTTKTGAGESAANRFAVVYELLATAAISQGQEPSSGAAKAKPQPKPKPGKSHSGASPAQTATKPVVISGVEPAIHIDIQVHISPDAKPEQIDAIFASLTKHLRDLRTAND